MIKELEANKNSGNQNNKKNKKEFILVSNAGSSSLKYTLYEKKNLKEIFYGHIDGIGKKDCFLKIRIKGKEIIERFFATDHLHASIKALHTLKHYGIINDTNQIKQVGHRVVHGGEKFIRPTKITKTVLKKISSLAPLAPLHNPPAIASILTLKKVLKKAEHTAVFDTAFHSTIAKEAYLYGIPYKLYKEKGIRKFGFHGISHEFVSKQARHFLGKKSFESEEIISCHLGNGSSITAIKNGVSIDTSMGFSPLDGLVMGTRSGAIDPEIIFYLLKEGQYTAKKLEEILQEKSGLYGIAGDSDVRKLHQRAIKRDEQARLALDMLSYRIAKYIGSYSASLKGLDAIVFTGGIGENAYYVRRKVCGYLSFLGVELEAHTNRKNNVLISKAKSKVKVLVIPTDENYQIATKIKK